MIFKFKYNFNAKTLMLYANPIKYTQGIYEYIGIVIKDSEGVPSSLTVVPPYHVDLDTVFIRKVYVRDKITELLQAIGVLDEHIGMHEGHEIWTLGKKFYTHAKHELDIKE